MKYTLYRTFEELGSPHRAIGSYTLEELKQMAESGKLHAHSWIEERGLMGGSHRVDRFGPLIEYVDKMAGSDTFKKPVARKSGKPGLLALIRANSSYRDVRDLISGTAVMLLVLIVLCTVVKVIMGLVVESIGAVFIGILAGVVGCLLVSVFKHALVVLVDIADTQLHGLQGGAAKAVESREG